MALQRLAETGEWMKVNSQSIYETVPQSPYAINVTGLSEPGEPGRACCHQQHEVNRLNATNHKQPMVR